MNTQQTSTQQTSTEQTTQSTPDADLINFRAVVPGKVYRGAAPYGYTADVAQAFAARHGIETIIDLRTTPEVSLAGWPGFADGVEVLAVPIDGAAGPVEVTALSGPADLGRMYVAWLEFAQAEMLRVVEPVADGRVTLLHCSAGKDRTGVSSAVLQLVAGHSDEEVIASYALTAQNMPAITSAMARAYGQLVGDVDRRLQQENPPAILTAPAEAMTVFLEGLRERYGSAQDYLRRAGASDEQVARLERALRD